MHFMIPRFSKLKCFEVTNEAFIVICTSTVDLSTFLHALFDDAPFGSKKLMDRIPFNCVVVQDG